MPRPLAYIANNNIMALALIFTVRFQFIFIISLFLFFILCYYYFVLSYLPQ